MKLLILNLAMDPNHPALAHQIRIVNALSPSFSNVFVITGETAQHIEILEKNITILSYSSSEGSRLSNIFKFYKQFLFVLIKFRPQVVFSHMSAHLSALASPFTFLLRKPHYLWYAHKKSNIALITSIILGCRTITSTRGSFPSAVRPHRTIGQGVESEYFYKQISTNRIRTPLNFVHIGRIDASKKIHLLIEAIERLRSLGFMATLQLIGDPLRPESRLYLDELQSRWCTSINEGWLIFSPSLKKDQVAGALSTCGFFIHAYDGSLDKTLVEAAMSGVPIATLNREFHSSFITKYHEAVPTLVDQILDILSLDEKSLLKELRRIQQMALEAHSFKDWIDKIRSEIMT